jgi:uncharacterized protein (UPF0333 family)
MLHGRPHGTQRAQGAFEYILLLAGVLLVVVIVIMLLRGSVAGQANQTLASGLQQWQQQTSAFNALSNVYVNSTNVVWTSGAGAIQPETLQGYIIGSRLDFNSTNCVVTVGVGACSISIPPDNRSFFIYYPAGFGPNVTIYFTALDYAGDQVSFQKAEDNQEYVPPCAGTGESCGTPGSCTNCSALTGYGPVFCFGKNRTREYRAYYCNGSSCAYNASNVTLEQCAAACSPEACLDYPPGVSLSSPANGSLLAPRLIAFKYVPTDDSGFTSATLYGNFTGTWSAYKSNSTPVINGSVNSFTAPVAAGAGDYSWNVQVCDNNATAPQCRFAALNWTSPVTALSNVWTHPSNPSPGSDALSSIVADSSGFLYAAGSDNATGDVEWRVEKLDASTGASVWNYTSNPSNSTDGAYAIAFDPAGFLYVVGYDNVPGDSEWRVEKLNAATGANVWNYTDNPSNTTYDIAVAVAFDPSGRVFVTGGDFGNENIRAEALYASNGSNIWNYTTNPAGGLYDCGYSIAFDPAGFVYVGEQRSGGQAPMGVEKLYASNGSKIWTYARNIVGGRDLAYSLAFDPAGFLYVGCKSDWRQTWQVEKLNVSDGSSVWIYSGNPSDNYRESLSVAFDPVGFVYVGGYDDFFGITNARWRVERLNASTGLLGWTNYTSNPSGSDDSISSLALDANGFVYCAGNDFVPGNTEWRVEKVSG